MGTLSARQLSASTNNLTPLLVQLINHMLDHVPVIVLGSLPLLLSVAAGGAGGAEGGSREGSEGGGSGGATGGSAGTNGSATCLSYFVLNLPLRLSFTGASECTIHLSLSIEL